LREGRTRRVSEILSNTRSFKEAHLMMSEGEGVVIYA